MFGNLVQVCLCSWDSKMEIPSSDSFVNPLRKGHLQKLTGRGWLYSGSWKKRYCVLEGSKFYFYENEQSKGNEKSCGVLNLDYYDVCEENTPKDKKSPHVFIIGTSVRGFFDNRHQFAAESTEELQAWIRAIQSAIEEARVSRRKPGRKRHLEGKSPDLSTSSQESEGTSTACLVNATKDRARGPQGRRLPQRKSMMPASRSIEDTDIRQRSISLSDQHRSNAIDEEDSSPSSKSPTDSKWLSLSMEEVDRNKDEGADNQRSSSVFDLPQQKEEILPQKPHKRVGNLLGQHAALTKELEMRLKSGRAPGHVRAPSESDEDHSGESRMDAKMEHLTSKVNSTTDALSALEDKVSVLMRRMETTREKDENATSQVGNALLQVTVTLQEAERINAECKRALADANRAKTEYQLLAKECKETLAKLNNTESQQNGA
ncbi:PH domain-containing protein [Nephila pilipes]|uniref:PH domain-containing protein n=1 Tax=Nephila pilipes TaxID=299642 RepID=A0A8X6QTN4_NEPPI|nr:PH domain-containing protein [Nephila pilipes]